jgi:hypothetical protein
MRLSVRCVLEQRVVLVLKGVWFLVVRRAADYTLHNEATGEPYDGRNPKAIAELMSSPECKRAGLMEVEAIGLRLYTGPAVSFL